MFSLAGGPPYSGEGEKPALPMAAITEIDAGEGVDSVGAVTDEHAGQIADLEAGEIDLADTIEQTTADTVIELADAVDSATEETQTGLMEAGDMLARLMNGLQ